jgi:hypothetical protein
MPLAIFPSTAFAAAVEFCYGNSTTAGATVEATDKTKFADIGLF